MQQTPKKTAIRVLIGLLGLAAFVVGFVLLRSADLRATELPASPLQDLTLSEDIFVTPAGVQSPVPDIIAWNSRQKNFIGGGMAASSAGMTGTPPVPTKAGEWGQAESGALYLALRKDSGRQLREGGVLFVAAPQRGDDGSLVLPTEEQKKAGKLLISTFLLKIEGKFVGHVRVEVQRPVYLAEGASRPITATVWAQESAPEVITATGAAMVPQLRAAARETLARFLREYREANGVRDPAPHGLSSDTVRKPGDSPPGASAFVHHFDAVAVRV